MGLARTKLGAKHSTKSLLLYWTQTCTCRSTICGVDKAWTFREILEKQTTIIVICLSNPSHKPNFLVGYPLDKTMENHDMYIYIYIYYLFICFIYLFIYINIYTHVYTYVCVVGEKTSFQTKSVTLPVLPSAQDKMIIRKKTQDNGWRFKNGYNLAAGHFACIWERLASQFLASPHPSRSRRRATPRWNELARSLCGMLVRWYKYPLVNSHNYGKSPCFIGKSTISAQNRWFLANLFIFPGLQPLNLFGPWYGDDLGQRIRIPDQKKWSICVSCLSYTLINNEYTIYRNQIYTSSTRASRGRKFQIWNAYSLYRTEQRLCL